MTKYYSTTETAKLIRAALKQKFPGVKFSVRSSVYAGGSSVDISWIDGPAAKLVDPVVNFYSGATFDGMTDMKSYHYREFNGEKVSFGPDFVFTNRKYSDEALEGAIAYVSARYANNLARAGLVLTLQDFKRGNYYHLGLSDGRNFSNSPYSWQSLIYSAVDDKPDYAQQHEGEAA